MHYIVALTTYTYVLAIWRNGRALMLVPFICVILGSNGNGVNVEQEAGKGPYIYYVRTCRERGLENDFLLIFSTKNMLT